MAADNSATLMASRAALVAMTRAGAAPSLAALVENSATASAVKAMAGALQMAGGVETGAQAGLLADLRDGSDVAAGNVGDEQLDGVGADVNDGAAIGSGGGQLALSDLEAMGYYLVARRASTAAPMMPASSPLLLATISTPLLVPLRA